MADNNKFSQGEDRRRSKRYGADQPAVLKIEGLSAFDCQIQDFCEAGFFVAAGPDGALQNILALVQVGTKLSVDYSSGPNSYSVAGEIARLSAEGLGIYAPSMNDAAFRALFAGKFKVGVPQATSNEVSGAQQLISQCREALFDFAKSFVPNFYTKAEEKLNQALEEATFSQRADFQHALNAMKADPSRAQSGFESSIREAVEDFENGRALKPKAETDSELSLVDKRGFEEWLAVSSIAYKIEGELTQELTEFEQRYARLSGSAVDRKNSPYAPETICRLFDEQLQKMELSEHGEEVAHKAMSNVLMSDLKDLYSHLHEVLESIDPVGRGGSSNAASAENEVEADSDASTDDQTAEQNSEETVEDALNDSSGSEESVSSAVPSGGQDSGNIGPAGVAHPEGANDAEIGSGTPASFASGQQAGRPVPKAQREYSFENLFRAIQRHSGVASGSADSGGGSASEGSSAVSSFFNPSALPPSALGGQPSTGYAGQSAGSSSSGSTGDSGPDATSGAGSASAANGQSPVSAAPTGRSIARALAGMRGASSGGRVSRAKAESRATSLPEPPKAEVVNLLDQIEPKSRAAGDGGSSLPLARRLSRKMEETNLAGLAEGQRERLNTVADIVDKAVSEYQPTSEIEALVVALEKPLLKLATVDSQFLEDEFHPARRFMNTLDQFAIAADDDGNFYDPKLFQFLNSLIESIVQEPTINRDIFEDSLGKISSMLLQLQQLRFKRVSLLQESSEARERVRSARSRTSEALDELLGGREVPVSALDLLDVGWRHHMNLIELRETSGSETWHNALNVLVDVKDCLAGTVPDICADEKGKLDESKLDSLLHKVESGLSKVSTDTDGVESLVATIKKQVLLAQKEPNPTREHIASPRQELVNHVNSGIARIGEWWSVPVSGKNIITQLIWKNNLEDKYAATNRSASRRWELNAEQFEKDIAAGKISRIGEGQFLLFERSEGALFDDLYKKLATQIVSEEHVGAVNRKGFLKKLDATCTDKDKNSILCMVEFDQFRVIRHNCGVQVCEELSEKLLAEIQETLEIADVISPFAEDSFMILMDSCDQKMAEQKVQKIIALCKDYKHKVGGDTYRLGVNIGLAECGFGEEAADTALRQVDSACVASKESGRNLMQFYDPANKQLKVQDSVMEMAGRIDRIIASGGLYLRVQMVMPVAESQDMAPYHEVLLGIDDEQGLRVVPEKFIQAVEQLRRTDELDTWVIKKTFAWIKENPKMFEELGGFSINLSGASLASSDVLEHLLEEIPKLDVPNEKLIFEITETAAIDNYDSAKDFLWEVRRLGCKFSLDDFGTGYASYSHLRKLRPDILKIDGSFIWNLASDNSDFVLVKSMNDIGKALGFSTVAEYVESAAIIEKLSEIGVDYAQGYAIHRPEPLEEMMKNREAE